MRAVTFVPWIAASALALTACGGGDERSSATTGTTPPSASVTTTGPSAAADAATSATQEVSGTGYRTTVPEGWSDQAKLFAGSAIRVDRAFASTSGATKGQNVVIIREDPEGLRGKTIDDVKEQLRAQSVQVSGASVPSYAPPFTLDGEAARGWSLRSRTSSVPRIQRTIAALHDDALYTITITVAANRDDSGAIGDALIAGWRWR